MSRAEQREEEKRRDKKLRKDTTIKDNTRADETRRGQREEKIGKNEEKGKKETETKKHFPPRLSQANSNCRRFRNSFCELPPLCFLHDNNNFSKQDDLPCAWQGQYGYRMCLFDNTIKRLVESGFAHARLMILICARCA